MSLRTELGLSILMWVKTHRTKSSKPEAAYKRVCPRFSPNLSRLLAGIDSESRISSPRGMFENRALRLSWR